MAIIISGSNQKDARDTETEIIHGAVKLSGGRNTDKTNLRHRNTPPRSCFWGGITFFVIVFTKFAIYDVFLQTVEGSNEYELLNVDSTEFTERNSIYYDVEDFTFDSVILVNNFSNSESILFLRYVA